MSNIEKQPNSAEKEKSLENIESSSEMLDELEKSLEREAEKAGEKSKETNEKLRSDAEKVAEDNEKAEKEKTQATPERSTHQSIGKKQRDTAFKKTMKEVQGDMKPAERVFSKFIHNKAVEKTSDILGSTIARPNAVMYGAIFAFFATLIVYLLARNLGYVLSGFETIGAFIVGWILGVVYDYLRILFTGKR
jgi:Fe2+ transport system protein B